MDALREGRDTAAFKADAKDVADPNAQLQALIAELGEDQVLEFIKNKA